MMKKLLCLLLAVTMLMGSLFILSACDEKKKDQDETEETAEKEEFKLPEGYAIYENDYISFAYPAEWSKTDFGAELGALFMDGAAGNSITAVSEPYSDRYKDLTVEEFKAMIEPMAPESGLSVSNIKIEQIKGTNDLAVTKISYDVVMQGVSMKQYVFVVASGDLNYSVSISETKAVEGLVDIVLASWVAKK